MAAALLLGTTGGLVAHSAQPALTAGDTVDLRLLLVGAPGGAASDPNTAAWAAGLTSQGVAYTEVDATGTLGSATVSLPALTSSATHGLYNGVVLAGKPADFAAGQLTSLFNYESSFGIRQIDGDFVPNGTVGLTSVTDVDSGAAISGTTATLTAAGLTTFPALNGPVPIDTGSFASPGTTVGVALPVGATETPLLNDAAGNVLIGLYQHPTAAQAPTDPQAGVAEVTVGFNYNANMTQWLLLGPGLIDWVTGAAHLGLYRNYSTIHVDDMFTPDDTWDITTHANNYDPTAALRMTPADVDAAAAWEKANNFRFDFLFNGGNATTNNVTSPTADPLLAEFQKIDPATGKPYTQDFGWLNHTWDHAYLDVGCATTNYIEAEVQQNSLWAASPPGATPGTGGLGLISSTDQSISPYGSENPSTLVPGGHSGFANLLLGAADAVDPPNLDNETLGVGGTLAAGSYQWAVTDQFSAADPPATDQSSASVTTPIPVAAGDSVSLSWQAVCHAANYLIYREVAGSNNWSLVGNLATPATETPPATLTADPASTTDTTGGGMQQQTFVDTGAAGTLQPGFSPPTLQDAHEMPWEQNPNFLSAMDSLNMTSVGTDASKPYPNPASATWTIGSAYSGTTYPALTAFPDGTFEGVPRHPVNVYYNNSTEAQAVDEYNTLYVAPPGGNCVTSSTTTCLGAPATFADIVASVDTGMFTDMVNNDPRPTYVHQTNIMGTPPAGPPTTGTPPATSTAVGDGLLYSFLNPLLSKYHTEYTATAPYQQPTMGQIGTILNNQSAWATTQPPGAASTANQVSANETGANITITNTGTTSVTVPITVPLGYEYNGALFGSQYGGSLSGWQTLTAGQSIVIAAVPPTVTSAPTANAQVGSPFTFTVTTSGSPAPAITETGTLPAGLTFAANATNGTATITGTPTAGTGGTYPITFTATNIAGVATQAFSLFVAQPSIGITPSTNPPSFAVAGTPITYSYTVTNTGNVSLTGIGVTDTLAGVSPVTCPGTTLAVAASETCTAHYSATQADVDAGGFTDAASAAGTAPSTTVVQASANVHTPAIQAPAIAVAPSANPGDFFGAGTPEAVSFLVTNSGNVTLHGISVTDPLAGLSVITCPSTPIAPAATGTCTASYTSTAADVKAKGITLAASVVGTPPTGPAVNGSTKVVIPLWSAPSITSAKLTTVPRQTKVKFTFTAAGVPAPLLTLTGTLPKGLGFTQGLGSAKFSGTVDAAGTYPLTLTATSPAGTAHQSYTLHVTAPELTSGVAAQPGNQQATVKWTPPVLHGGLPVTGYVVTPYIGHDALPSHMFHSTAKHQVITGLDNGHTYTFKVAAMNRLGTGPDSLTASQINALGVGPITTASAAIKIGAPTAPNVVTATPTNPSGALVVRFSAASGNGTPVTSYLAVCVSHDGGPTRSALANGNTQSVLVPNVAIGKTYTCTVTATNKRGTGPPTTSNQVVA